MGILVRQPADWFQADRKVSMRIGILVALSALYTVATLACGDDDSAPQGSASPLTTFRVEGAGMAPTLENGTLVEVFDYGDSTPARGDVIVFRSPVNPSRDFIKRVIAAPGDTIRITGGQVMINGEVLDEPYAFGATECDRYCTQTMPTVGSPESEAMCNSSACYFVLGDNRPNSSDSRQDWYVPRENIIGWVDVRE